MCVPEVRALCRILYYLRQRGKECGVSVVPADIVVRLHPPGVVLVSPLVVWGASVNLIDHRSAEVI